MTTAQARTAATYADRTFHELLSLEGRVAVVTGGALGIGAAIARRLHLAGARVVIGDLDVQAAEALVQQLDGSGATVLALHLDVTQSDSLIGLAEHALSHFGRLDIWINNAGGRADRGVLEIGDDELDSVLKLNLRSVFVGAREAARRMVDAGRGGVIVNLASVASFSTSQGENPAHYVACKHAVVGLTKSLAAELGQHGIRAVAVAPTLTESTGVRKARAGGAAKALDAYAAALPLGRSAYPDEVACAVLFAASELGSFVSGSTLLVDGGDLAR